MSVIAVTFDDLFISMAEEKAVGMKVKSSIRKDGDRVYVGCLGEIVFVDYFGGIIKDKYDFDVLINGRNVDIKTKSCKSVPQLHYLCDIPKKQQWQECDSYYFIRIDISKIETERIGTAYLLGGLTKKAFYQKAKYYEAMKAVEGSPIGFKYTHDSWAVTIEQLIQPNASSNYSYAASRSY